MKTGLTHNMHAKQNQTNNKLAKRIHVYIIYQVETSHIPIINRFMLLEEFGSNYR